MVGFFELFFLGEVLLEVLVYFRYLLRVIYILNLIVEIEVCMYVRRVGVGGVEVIGK